MINFAFWKITMPTMCKVGWIGPERNRRLEAVISVREDGGLDWRGDSGDGEMEMMLRCLKCEWSRFADALDMGVREREGPG